MGAGAVRACEKKNGSALFLNLEDCKIVRPLEKETGQTLGEPLLKMNVWPFCFVIGRTVLRHVLDKKFKTKFWATWVRTWGCGDTE